MKALTPLLVAGSLFNACSSTPDVRHCVGRVINLDIVVMMCGNEEQISDLIDAMQPASMGDES